MEYVDREERFEIWLDDFISRNGGHQRRGIKEIMPDPVDIFEAGYESRQPEIDELKAAVQKYDIKADTLRYDKEKLETENDKLRKALERIIDDCSDDLSGNACEYIKQALKGGS